MNAAVRQALVRIITEHGRSVVDDPRKCEALLRDYCGQYKREINVLVGAIKEGVAHELTANSAALPPKVLVPRLARRLQDNLGYSEAASNWAVESWALALGVIAAAELGESEPTQVTPLTATESSSSLDPEDPFIQATPGGVVTAPPEETLRQALRIVFADDVATEYEKADLRRIRERLGIPADVASRVFAEVKRERSQANQNLQVKPSAANTLIVSQQRGAQYATISQAVRSAAPGTHIHVKPGLYRESLVIDRPISISADGRAGEVIVESIGSPCLVTRAAQIKVRGLTLQSLISDERNRYFAVDISSGQLTLEDCTVISDADACISVHGPGVNPEIRRCRVRDGGVYGVWVWDDAAGIIEECEISNCAGAGLVISGDTMEEARQMAADILADISDGRNIIDPSSINNRGDASAKADTGGMPHVRRCSISGGQDHGVWVHYKGRALIEHCRVYENSGAGVWVDQGSEAAVRHSNINRNDWEAMRVTGASMATVEDCDLSGNANGPWAVERGCQVRESGNKV
ncbi:MAG TPA: right-handed parallel beta-helix repeat-containing protein [Blastocatellia bacterium]|nr:right-handed parallel beta-helix repeat-containing protein [Blastocatellia bacterium]